MRALFKWFLCFFAICASASAVHALMVTLPPTLKDVVGTWVGGTGAEYLRLEFDSKGLGLLTIKYNTQVDAHIIVGTKLNNEGAIRFSLKPVGQAEPLELYGTTNGEEMDLNVGNRENKWMRKAVLEREEEVVGRIKAVDDRAKEFKEHRDRLRSKN